MAAEQFGNLAATTLSSGVDNAVTTLPVTSGALPFPQAAQFRVVVDSEIMLVTGGAGTNSWTVTRGAESTTAASHLATAAVTHVLTAGALGVVSDPAAAVPGLRTLGTGATQAAGGTDSRLSDSRSPTAHKTSHEPGGTDALTLLDNSSIKAAAGIVLSKLATDPLARANHTGTQTMSTISDAGALATKSAVASADITDGTIVDADINAAAAIAKTKVSGTAITAADTGTITSTMILDGTILNADVNASAAIAATKVAQPIPPDQHVANSSLYLRANATYAGQFPCITALKPIFIPISIPGVAFLTLANLRFRISTLNSGQTIGAAIYSATYASSAHVSATLVAQLNAAASTTTAVVVEPVITTGAAGSGAAPLAMDFTTTRYLLGVMGTDVTTAKAAGYVLPAADSGLGVISWTGTARSTTTDWPSSFTEAASIAAVTANTPMIAVDLLTATGAFYL